MLGRPADDGACAVDQLAPEIVVGASSDAAEPWLAASCILPGHQPDPGCHLAARAKLTAIVDAADDRRGDDRPHPRQLCEPPTSLIRAAEGDDHCVELLDPAIEVVELVRIAASKIASASTASFLEPLTNGFTKRGLMRRTSRPAV